jgi:hypothetical protein
MPYDASFGEKMTVGGCAHDHGTYTVMASRLHVASAATKRSDGRHGWAYRRMRTGDGGARGTEAVTGVMAAEEGTAWTCCGRRMRGDEYCTLVRLKAQGRNSRWGLPKGGR